MIHLLIVLLCSLSLCLASELEVKFSDIETKKGSILYLVFKSEKGFPNASKESAAQGELPAAKFDEGLKLDLPDGDYALSVFHDEDSNGKLNKNFLGLPKESFGFSNNPRIYFGPPSFDKAKFSVQGKTVIEVRLKQL